jgi:hypothetical protein
VVNATDKGIRDDVLKVINDNTSVFHVKSQVMETNQLAMIVEVRTKDGNALIDGVSKLDGVTRCSLVSHDGEVTF